MYIRVYCSYGRIRVYVLVSISCMCVVLCLCSVLLPKYICAYVGETVTLVYIVCYCLVGNFPEVSSPKFSVFRFNPQTYYLQTSIHALLHRIFVRTKTNKWLFLTKWGNFFLWKVSATWHLFCL